MVILKAAAARWRAALYTLITNVFLAKSGET